MFGGRTGEGRRIWQRSYVKGIKPKEFERRRIRLRLENKYVYMYIYIYLRKNISRLIAQIFIRL